MRVTSVALFTDNILNLLTILSKKKSKLEMFLQEINTRLSGLYLTKLLLPKLVKNN